jgi:colicin import membrane protein/protein TonB
MSAAAHALLVIWGLARAPAPAIDLQQKPIVAKLVRLGEKRPEQWLPRKEAEPPAPPAPAPAQAPAAPVAAPRSSPAAPPAKPAPTPAARPAGASLASIMSKVQRQADEERWGDPSGDAAGGSDAAEGDQYLALVDRALRANYRAPVTIAERERLYLEADVILWIEPDGRISRWRLERPSGNATFDAAVERTLRVTPRVPPPPDHLRDSYRTTGIKLVFQARPT